MFPDGDALEDVDFADGADLITYRIATEGRPGPFQVTVDLLYQATSHRFAGDLLQDDTPLVESFAGYFEAADKMPVVMASRRQTVK